MMKKFLSNFGLLTALFALVAVFSCKKEDAPEVISGFTYKPDAANFLKVDFTNASQNYATSAWDFGDGSTSTDANPSHTYSKAGAFTVKLTVTSDDGHTDASSQVVTIVDPDAELTKLTGAVSKTWKLLRVVNGNRWPLEVGPVDATGTPTQVWWAQGRDNDEIALRPCIMNDEWVFSRDGKKMQFKTNGDYWAEGGVFEPANECRSSAAINMTGPGGTDLSAFGDGTHSFVLTPGTKPTLEVVGNGAFLGLPKIGTDTEVKTPQSSVKFDLEKLSDGDVDTLIVISKWKFQNNTSGVDDAYWRIVLVSYDDPSKEPAIPNPSPQPIFQVGMDKLTVTFTNNSKYSNSYAWDFGDGQSSTETSPVHTYAAPGEYKVKLSATNAVATISAEQTITVTDGVILLENITGGAWKIRKAANSIYVGPGLGSPDWWQVPLAGLEGTATGAEDWSCITDDEFIFSTNGSYEYKTNGTARNDGYMGTPQGCWSDAQVAASGNGAAFGSATHTFQFIPASGTSRARLVLTNGSTGAAFVGFYKGYYGGENSDATKPPNGGNATNEYEVISYLKSGGVETLVVSVDISGAHDGSAAWTMVLVR